MVLIENTVQSLAKEPTQPIMTNHFVSDDIPCISRRTDVVSDKVDSPFPISALGVGGGVKWQVGSRLNDFSERWIFHPISKLAQILLNFGNR